MVFRVQCETYSVTVRQRRQNGIETTQRGYTHALCSVLSELCEQAFRLTATNEAFSGRVGRAYTIVKESRPEVCTLILVVFIRRLSPLVDGSCESWRGCVWWCGNGSKKEAPMKCFLVVKSFPIAPIAIQTTAPTNPTTTTAVAATTTVIAALVAFTRRQWLRWTQRPPRPPTNHHHPQIFPNHHHHHHHRRCTVAAAIATPVGDPADTGRRKKKDMSRRRHQALRKNRLGEAGPWPVKQGNDRGSHAGERAVGAEADPGGP